MRLTLKAVLIGIVSLLVMTLAGQALMAESKIEAMNAKVEDISTNWLPSERALGEIKYLASRYRLQANRFMMASDAKEKRDLQTQMDTSASQISKALRNYDPRISSPDERKIWDSFNEKWNSYIRIEQQALDLAKSGNTTAAALVFSTAGRDAFYGALAAIDSDVEWNGKEADRAVAQSRETYGAAKFATLVFAGFALMLGIASTLFVIFRVTLPLQRMNSAMGVIAEGNLDTKVIYTERRDEIGDMAKALQVFKENGLRVRQMEVERKETELGVAVQRKADMQKIANDFEGAVGEIIETVSSASTELEASAGSLTSTAERAQEVTTMVAAASEEASSNVQSVAAATEEMASSVNEISRQVQESARIAQEAVYQARKTNERVSQLTKAASRIGDVVELINNIAGQTNLLALNATIEAARAGDAGRGFAVVASEVKALAEQTAKATGEISEQIAGMQTATDESVGAIKEISDTIARMSEISSAIASAVEQQGSATQEISRNVQQAAQGTKKVSSSVVGVQRGATETGSASSQVLSAAQSLSRDSNRLKLEVEKFLNTVRVA